MMKKQNLRTLVLIASTLVYLLIGAAVFQALESANEADEHDRLLDEENTLRSLFNISDEGFQNITRNVIQSIPHKAGIQWKFTGSLYFVTTVITTIGYGHSTPKTVGGKVFCMLYALTGIPLNLVMFQSIGERLNILVTYLLRFVKRGLRFKHTDDISQTFLIFISMNMSCLVVAGGAWMFCQFEESWTYIESFYYCVITLTTVGFGDFVALQSNNALQNRPKYVAFSLIFILCGLAVVSAAMNLLVLRFLTMNTEDERRDEQRAALRRSIVQMDPGGRLLTVVNGGVGSSSLRSTSIDAVFGGYRRSISELPAQLSLQFNEDEEAVIESPLTSSDRRRDSFRPFPVPFVQRNDVLEAGNSDIIDNENDDVMTQLLCCRRVRSGNDLCCQTFGWCGRWGRSKTEFESARYTRSKMTGLSASSSLSSSSGICGNRANRRRRQRYRVTRPPSAFVSRLLQQQQQQQQQLPQQRQQFFHSAAAFCAATAPSSTSCLNASAAPYAYNRGGRGDVYFDTFDWSRSGGFIPTIRRRQSDLFDFMSAGDSLFPVSYDSSRKGFLYDAGARSMKPLLSPMSNGFCRRQTPLTDGELNRVLAAYIHGSSGDGSVVRHRSMSL